MTSNQLFYEQYIKNNAYLNIISYSDNGLIIKDNDVVVKEVLFNSSDDLAKLPLTTYKINNPYKFLEVLAINNECEISFNDFKEESEGDLTKTIQINRMYIPLRIILTKETTTEEEDRQVMDFLVNYNKMVNYNDYLTTRAIELFKQMASVINWTMLPDQNKPNNNAQLIVKQYYYSLINQTNNDFINSYYESAGGLNKGSALARKNPNAPSIINSDSFSLEKGGFMNFLALIYLLTNLFITLMIIAIKK